MYCLLPTVDWFRLATQADRCQCKPWMMCPEVSYARDADSLRPHGPFTLSWPRPYLHSTLMPQFTTVLFSSISLVHPQKTTKKGWTKHQTLECTSPPLFPSSLQRCDRTTAPCHPLPSLGVVQHLTPHPRPAEDGRATCKDLRRDQYLIFCRRAGSSRPSSVIRMSDTCHQSRKQEPKMKGVKWGW